jgi:hypothetical protein
LDELMHAWLVFKKTGKTAAGGKDDDVAWKSTTRPQKRLFGHPPVVN